MLLIGLDAASDFKKFGYSLGQYQAGRVTINRAGLVSTTDEPNALIHVLAPTLREVDNALIAIDAPLGWPAAMSLELSTHRAGEPLASEKNEMFRRATDRHVKDLLNKTSLDVGADKIARAAHTALMALACLRAESGLAIPLAWNTEIRGVMAIEVYPAGTLRARGLPDSKYKKPEELKVRQEIALGLENEIAGLKQFIDGPSDVFDACLCMVAAKDFLEGVASTPTNFELALQEGWIWVRKP